MVLRAMETVVSNHIGELDKDMARAIILLASNEMTKVKVWGIPALTWLTRPWLGQGAVFFPSALRTWVCVWLPWVWPVGPVY